MGGSFVRQARLRAGLSQGELAARLGVPQSTVARWERGKMEPGFDSVRRAVRACGLDLDVRLISRDDSLDSLIDRHLLMTPGERLAQNNHMVNLIEGARARMAPSRGA